MTMESFGKYAHYYNLLYRDKDYEGETAFVDGLLQAYAPGSRALLELGCGSGNHAARFAKLGYRVAGVDMSAGMVAEAQQRLATLPRDIAERLSFHEGDIRSVRVAGAFDCAISLFHVISYQTSNDDVLKALATARHHLKPGGVFVFDVWYGPAVMTDRPVVRVKRMADDQIEVTRLAEPVMHFNDCIVDVNYSLFIRERASGEVEELKETHRMRYFFRPELEVLALSQGFKLEASCEWMTKAAPSEKTWGVCFVMRAV